MTEFMQFLTYKSMSQGTVPLVHFQTFEHSKFMQYQLFYSQGSTALFVADPILRRTIVMFKT